MSNYNDSSGKSYNSPSVFGQATNANTSAFGPIQFGAGGSSASFGTTASFSQAKPSLFGSGQTSGANSASVFGAFGQPYNSSSIFGQTSNANSSAFGPNLFGTGGSSVSFGTTTGVYQGRPSLFGFAPTSGTNTSSVFGGATGFDFSNQCTGSRGAAYSATTGEDNEKLQSLSAMPVNSCKSHEELRLEDYNAGDRGYQRALISGTTGFDFSNQCTGSRGAAYSVTTGKDNEKLQSLAAMPVNSGKSHEELRLEDYNAGDRGGIVNQIVSGGSFELPSSWARTSSPFNPKPSLDVFAPQTSYNAYSTQTTSSLLFPQTSPGWFPPQNTSISFPTRATSSLFSPLTSSGWFPPQTCSAFSPQTSSCLFSDRTLPSFLPAQTSTNPFVHKSPLVQFCPGTSFYPLQPRTSSNGSSTLPSFSPFSNQTSLPLFSPQIPTTTFTFPSLSDPIAPRTSSAPFPQTISPSIFSPHSTTNGASISAALPALNNLRTCICCPTVPNPCPGLNSLAAPGGQSNSLPFVAPTPSVSTSNANACAQIPSLPTPWHSAETVRTTNLQPSAEVVYPSNSSQAPAPPSTVVGQPMAYASPIGELASMMSRLEISLPGSTISVQDGISSITVHDKPCAPVRLSSSLTSRHSSHHQMRLPDRKDDSRSDDPKVPIFSKDEDRPYVKASTLVPGDNPRSLVLSAEVWPHRSATEEISPGMNADLHGDEYGISSSENNTTKVPYDVLNIDLTVYEHVTKKNKQMDDIEALMPRLSLPDYFTQPPIKQLAEKERAEPGFCSRVHDFEIGRYGYGSIKFLGETDVRRLCLDSVVEFDNHEIAVFKNKNEKHPVGKGLNKLAEVTLLNILCIDKKTGKKYVDGPKVEKYKERLIKKGEEHGVEFISFDPVNGEWRFRVPHF